VSHRSSYSPSVTIVSDQPAHARTTGVMMSSRDRSRAWLLIALVGANTLLPIYDLYLLLSGLR
jgi:hypothetical protein